MIEEDWLIKISDKIFTKEIFSFLHKQLAGECPEPPYRSTDDLWNVYVKSLHILIPDKLYYTYKGCYTLEELEKMVPFIDDPLFNRNYVIYKYMEKMEGLKPRGPEWKTQMDKLK